MRALLIEDHDHEAELIATQLQRGFAARGGLDLVRVRSLAEGLLRVGGADVVLLDLTLPDSRGLVGLETLLVAPRPPPVIVLTGQEDLELALAAVQRGAQDFVSKGPSGGELLVKAILYGVERHRLSRDLETQARRLESSEASFRGIASQADGLVTLDRRGTVLWANDAAIELLGGSGADLVGTRFPHALSGDALVEVHHEGRVLEIRTVETIWDGQDARLASIRDMTRRAAAESQLLQAQKVSLLGQLAGGVSHAFSNLLTGLMGHADLLREQCVGRPETRPHVDALVRDLSYAARLTAQLRTFGRPQVLAPQPTDLNLVVEALGPLLTGLVGEGIRLEVDLAPGLPLVVVDPGQLEQVLLNLVSNGRDACAPGGRVQIQTAPSAEGGGVLVVRDDGRGMDRATLARATEPFFTAGGATSPGQVLPMGLGLSTVRDIVNRSGGALRIESSLELGTEVRVELPGTGELRVETTGRMRRLVVPTETVLVVDDEPVVRDLLKRVLEGRGYRVMVAASGPLAIDRCLGYAGPLDLLITDVMMPEMNGRELAATLRTLRPGLRVLFISGYEERILGPTGVLGDRVDFLAKPFRMQDALRAVRGALERVPLDDEVEDEFSPRG